MENILENNAFNKPVPNQGRKVINQLPKNPMDKSTIVSIFPRVIQEEKPTLFPGKFVIPAAPIDSFSLLVVESSSYYIPSQIERMPPTEIQVNSAALAQSIVNDYLVSVRRYQTGIKGPGVFWIPGNYNMTTVLMYADENGKHFTDLVKEARVRQTKWFVEIIDEADEFWARTSGNPKSIPEDAKMAAEILQVKGKPWMENVVAASLSPCKSCGEMINPNYPVCKFCHAVLDQKKADELGIVFAK